MKKIRPRWGAGPLTSSFVYYHQIHCDNKRFNEFCQELRALRNSMIL